MLWGAKSAGSDKVSSYFFEKSFLESSTEKMAHLVRCLEWVMNRGYVSVGKVSFQLSFTFLGFDFARNLNTEGEGSFYANSYSWYVIISETTRFNLSDCILVYLRAHDLFINRFYTCECQFPWMGKIPNSYIHSSHQQIVKFLDKTLILRIGER